MYYNIYVSNKCKLQFGKYKNYSTLTIFVIDPEYYIWLLKNDNCRFEYYEGSIEYFNKLIKLFSDKSKEEIFLNSINEFCEKSTRFNEKKFFKGRFDHLKNKSEEILRILINNPNKEYKKISYDDEYDDKYDHHYYKSERYTDQDLIDDAYEGDATYLWNTD